MGLRDKCSFKIPNPTKVVGVAEIERCKVEFGEDSREKEELLAERYTPCTIPYSSSSLLD